MYEHFTEKAIKVIMLAQEEARRLRHNFVGTEQILLGLYGEGTGIAARVLRAQNIKLKDLRATVLGIIGKGSGSVSAETPFTPRAKKLLEFAWDAARQLGHNYIGTEHLLLGLLAADDGTAKQVLSILGVDLEKMKGDVFDLLQTSNRQPQVASENPAHAPASAPAQSQAPTQSYSPTQAHTPAQSDALVRSVKGPVASQSVKASVPNSDFTTYFSESAIIAMQLAQEEALRVGSMKLELHHLLLGILSEGSSEAAKLLVAQAVKLEELRLATKLEDEEKLSDSEPLEFQLVKQVIFAVQMATVGVRRAGSSLITPEHLLLALLSYEESRAVKGLQKLGVNIELFVDELRKVIKALNVAQAQAAAAAKEARAAEAASLEVDGERKQKADSGTAGKQLDLPQSALVLTEMLERAIVLATEEAHRLGHAEVDTDHLLLGLMTEADGLASLALHVWDVKTKELRQESENMPGREKAETPCESRCGSKVNELILAARNLAQQSKHVYVGTDHVLLALLADEDSAGLKVLRNLSIDTDRLKKMLQNANIPLEVGAKYSSIVPLAKQRGFERFSDEAIRALMFAKEEAFRLGHSQIGSQFLLLGICDERLNKGAERLRKIGISLDDLRFEVEHLTGYGDGDCGSGFSFGEHAVQALAWCLETVVGAGIEVIRPEHLFVGIILEESGPAFALLQQFNISIERLRAKTILKSKQSVPKPSSAADIERVRLIFGTGYTAICESMSTGSASAILRGYSEAKILSHAVFEPSHILLGLFDERNCIAAKAAQMNGLDASRLRLFIERINDRAVSESKEISVLTQTELALLAARDFAELCGSSLIEPDHLLFGVLKNDSCLGLLHALNLDYKNFRETVFELFKEAHSALSMLEPATIPIGTRTSSLKLVAADVAQLFVEVEACVYRPPSGSFSQTAKAAMRLAAFEARRLGRDKVGTDHVLLGICSSEDSVAATALKEIGVTSNLLRNRIEERLGRGKRRAVKELSFSKDAIQAFEKAFYTAQSVGSTSVTPDRLFAGILTLHNVSDTDSPDLDGYPALAVLRSLGVDLAWLQRSVLSRLTPQLGENLDTAVAQPHSQSHSRRAGKSAIAINRFENFAADSLKAVLLAHEEARESRRNLVDTEQILVALLLDKEGKAGRILDALGLTVEIVREGIEHLFFAGPGVAVVDEIYSADASRAFLQAQFNADFFKSKIGADILLLSMITNQKSQASIVLDWAGVDLDKLQEIMNDKLSACYALQEGVDPALKSGECINDLISVAEYRAALKKTVEQVQGQSKEQISVSEQKSALQAEPIAAPDLSQTALNQAALGVTATAERAMKLAANEAKLMGHNFVGTEQVMLGLIAAGNSVGGQVLLRQGLILLEVRHRVKAIIGLGPGAVAEELPYTPRTKRMLDLALNEAQRLKHEEIGTGHMLLGLLREGHGVAARVLTELGLNLDTLIEETEVMLLEDMERKSSGSGEFER